MILYPQNNTFRQFLDLSGIWEISFDPGKSNPENGFLVSRPIAVPGSWNDQFENERDNLGPAWYQTTFHRPWGFEGKQLHLRFGSVNYLADVWLNGQYLGQHEGGHLPFSFDVTDIVKESGNLLVVRVDGELAFDRVPPGNVTGEERDFFTSHAGNFPQAQFDFFPFCGIHRPVFLVATPPNGIEDVMVTTQINGSLGHLHVKVRAGQGELTAKVVGYGQTAETVLSHGEGTLQLSNAHFWEPATPNLYDLTIEQWLEQELVDSYTLRIGVREVKIDGDQILLNGKPIYLTGFGRHEDFPISGRGLNQPVNIKDFALLKWIGANSFRTTHYPYSEEMMQLADELGFLIIDEIPAVGLYFREDGLEKRYQICEQQIEELIVRDKNHPSVIMWSIANEPHSDHPNAVPFFEKLTERVRELDSSRPVTVVSFTGLPEESFAFLDVVCLNRYYGWYSETGRIDLGCQLLSDELDQLYEKYRKPLILTEFGTDTIPGMHAQPPEMFTEEYQVEFLTKYIEVLRSKPFVIGEHVWNLCDFKTSQNITRVGGLNHKGVFTRDRRPKMAAHKLREIWHEQ